MAGREIALRGRGEDLLGLAALLVAIVLSVVLGPAALAQSAPDRIVTQGLAKTVTKNLYTCPVRVRGARQSAVGVIKTKDGGAITVPAETAFARGPKLADLFNECRGVRPRNANTNVGKAPIVEIDPDGEVVTGYIVGDNYFELYVNGKLVGVDPVPYTPFNSVIVRFKVKKPYTVAIKAVDWEERLGLGMETFHGNRWHAGDGGLMARFSDGTVTDKTWKAQSFYIAPLAKPGDVVEKGNVHATPGMGRVYPAAKTPKCRERCFAVHYPLPATWAAADFDDSRWPQAFEFTDSQVGVDHIPAYTRYRKAFAGARWVWSNNLVFDNLVVARKTVR